MCDDIKTENRHHMAGFLSMEILAVSLSTHRLLSPNPSELGVIESLVPLSNLFRNWSVSSKVIGGNC